MRDASVGLLAVPEVRLRDEDVSHAEHAESAQFLGSIEHYGREPTRHLTVQAHLNPCLDLVFALDKQIKH